LRQHLIWRCELSFRGAHALIKLFIEEVEMWQGLGTKFIDAHEILCDSVGDLQLVLAVTVLGKEGCGRDKSIQNVVNYKRNMVERGVAKFDDSQLHLGTDGI
jgi:hypothetical protein